MIYLNKFKTMFTPAQLSAVLKFEESRYNKNIYLDDVDFQLFIDKTVYYVLLPEDIDDMKTIASEDIFFEALYFYFLMYGSKINRADFVLSYCHYNSLFDHYEIIDKYLELY